MLAINMIHSGSSIGMAKMIGIFIVAMIFIKLLGYLLICAAGPECITYHDRVGGSYADALEAGCGAGAIAMVWKLMKIVIPYCGGAVGSISNRRLYHRWRYGLHRRRERLYQHYSTYDIRRGVGIF
jgi:hypothetical protein